MTWEYLHTYIYSLAESTFNIFPADTHHTVDNLNLRHLYFPYHIALSLRREPVPDLKARLKAQTQVKDHSGKVQVKFARSSALWETLNLSNHTYRVRFLQRVQHQHISTHLKSAQLYS